MRNLRQPKRVAVPNTSFEPCQVDVLELSAPFLGLQARIGPDGSVYRRSRVLTRIHGQPLGTVVVRFDGSGATAADVRRAVDETLGDELAAHLANDGLPSPTASAGVDGRPGRARCLGPEIDAASAPLVSVVVCTYTRCDQLSATLTSLLASDYPNFEILVVDNNPSDPSARALIDARYGDERRVRYVREWSRGLSRARNAGYMFSRGEIVAFTDDDVIVDRSWITALASAFALDDEVNCVTGLVLGAELDTPSQQYFEDFGGFAKGFCRQVFDLDGNRPTSPLFPWASGMFGTGANSALRKSALGDLWEFDPALGTGTMAAGGEDLDCFAELILAGNRLVYEPRALLWHSHVRDDVELRFKLYSYGIGFSAYLTKQFVRGSTPRMTMVRAIPACVRYVREGNSRHDLPCRDPARRALLLAELRGVSRGPWAYFRSRLHNAWLTA
jgi:glycosyltransferase involved in cell wall biosynthesis